jgi:Double zinc ribbon
MKSSTGELLDLHVEANAEPPRSGFTGALELYDELINFLGLTPETQPQAAALREPTAAPAPSESAVPPTAQPVAVASESTAPASQAAPSNPVAAVAAEEMMAVNAAANSGALSGSEDVIRITGMLSGTVASAAGSVIMACGDCGQASDNGEMFCIHCGGLLEEPAAHAEAVTPSATEYCDDCGAMVERDEIFCPSCGSVMANA